MKKFVLKLDLQDDREMQRKALKTVSTLPGIDEMAIDLKGKKLTIIGTVDPVSVVSKLRKKNWPVDIIFVGPKEEPKKEEPKKEEGKKEEGKKEEGKKEEGKKEEGKKEEGKKEEEKKPEPELVLGTAFQYRPLPYYPPINRYQYVNHSMEENPNACVIM